MESGALHTRHRTVFLADKRTLAHLRRHSTPRTRSHKRGQLLHGDHSALHGLHREMDLVLPLGRHVEHRRQEPCATLLKLRLQTLLQTLVLKNTRIQFPGRMLNHLRKPVELFRIAFPVLDDLIVPHHDILRIFKRLQRLPQESGRFDTPLLKAPLQLHIQLRPELLHRTQDLIEKLISMYPVLSQAPFLLLAIITNLVRDLQKHLLDLFF